MDYDRRYQEGKNGRLSKEVRERLNRFRTLGYTLAEIGEAIGFSGPFVSQLLNPKAPGRIRSIHIPKIIEALDRAERAEEEKAVPGQNIARPMGSSTMSLEDHIRAIDALGFSVTVSPKSR